MHNFKELKIWQLIIAFDLGFLIESDFNNISEKIEEIKKMIFGFRKSLTKINK